MGRNTKASNHPTKDMKQTFRLALLVASLYYVSCGSRQKVNQILKDVKMLKDIAVRQAGLSVAIVIAEEDISECSFEISFNPNVCDNLIFVGGKVDREIFDLPIDPRNTRACTITKITSRCTTLDLPEEVQCQELTAPAQPPSPMNYVFEFRTNAEGCALIAK